MNDNISTVLKTHIERTVTPILAGRWRKQQIQEEMLAHLLSLYDEEFARWHDEQKGLTEAIRRFGTSVDLCCDLQGSVPFLERVFYHLIGPKERIMWRLFLIFGCVAVLVGTGFVCPALAQILFHEVMTQAIVLLVFGSVVTLAGAWSVFHGIQKYRMRSS